MVRCCIFVIIVTRCFTMGEMALEHVRIEVVRILHAHAAELGRAAHVSRIFRALLVEQKEHKRGE